MSSEDIEEVSPKGDPIVKYCPIDGVEFSETVLTNRWLKCDSCEQVFQVRAKKGD